MAIDKIFSVSQINNLLKINIEENEYFKNINVNGEISNLTFNKSGHVYFSLKDEKGSIKCMIWKSNAHKIADLNLKEGTKITGLGRITFYEPSGQISFEIKDVQLDGIGELQQLYDRRFLEYKQKGYFDKEIKKDIPRYPINIGIVTAQTGAAIKDLITTMKRRFPQINIFLFPAAVQGKEAPTDISNKIKQANNFPTPLDTLIVGRGGGSYEDLWCFNEVEVIEAIYNSKIPVISAIGHEPDYTISDYVADIRAATPTAAGEISTPDKENVKNLLNNLKIDFTANIKSKLASNKNIFNINFNNIINAINSKIKLKKHELLNINKSFMTLLDNKLLFIKNQIANFDNVINLQDPTKPFDKGFALLTMNKKGINSIKSIKKDDRIIAILKDGKINMKVE